jgi:hypothetical protein
MKPLQRRLSALPFGLFPLKGDPFPDIMKPRKNVGIKNASKIEKEIIK